MRVVIAHREVSGVYLCHEGAHWYWGPREQAKEYSAPEVHEMLRSFPKLESVIGVRTEDAQVELDTTPETVPPPRPS
jgi:hypothetical protein